MGSNKVDLNVYCPYCCKQQKSEGFQEIENLIDTGWVIYRYSGSTEYGREGGEAGTSTSIPQDVFILFHKKNQKMAGADLLPQIDKKRLPCPRCRQKIEHAQKLINKGAAVDTPIVVGVCDNCLLTTITEEPCCKCARVVDKFLAVRGEQKKDTNNYFKLWLTKMQHVLNKAIPEVKSQKKSRSFSEINISLLSGDTSKPIVKCKVQEMFHSEVDLIDTSNRQKVRQPASMLLGLEKAVNFADFINLHQTMSSDTDIKNIELEQNIRNKYGSFIPHVSKGAEQNIRSSITETLSGEDEREQMLKTQNEKFQLYLKSIPYETENTNEYRLKPETSLIFPQVKQEPDMILKRYVSSSELIRLTHEKLHLKTEEVEKRIKNKHETRDVIKDSSRDDEKIIKPLVAGQETKVAGEPSKKLEAEMRLGKVKTDRLDEGLVEKQEVVQSKNKDNLAKPTKVGDQKKKEEPTSDVKQLAKLKKIENKNVQDVMTVRKPEGNNIMSEVTRKRKGSSKDVSGLEKEPDEIQSKKKNESPKTKPDKVEKVKEVGRDRDNHRQLIDKGKTEKANKLGDSTQKDIKLNEVKLLKDSPDDLVTGLIKVNTKGQAKDTIRSEQPDLSKLIANTKAKDKITEKLTNTQESKKKDGKLLLPSKEKQDIELKMNEVKIVENNPDAVLGLITLKSGEAKVGDKSRKKESVKRNKSLKSGDTEEDDISFEDIIREEPTQTPKTFGRGGPAPFSPPQREGQDIKPLYVQLTLSEISLLTPLKATDEDKKVQLEMSMNVEKTPELVMSKKKNAQIADSEANKGIIRYALSDRSFIEKGWTMLPVEKVVRKMNIYRMRPAKPEFDWFEHNKKKGLMLYDTGAKLAEFDSNGRGRWFYKNGRLALDYYEAQETNTQQRFVVYSNGEVDERGRSRPITILATFDHLGNGVVFDHAGKIRLKYNQTEGVLLDRNVGPVTNWKWHSLNDPPVLQQVMIDTQMPLKDPTILRLGGPADIRKRPDDEEMLAIEFDNFVKEKSKKLTQTFKPFQIKMKALKINEQFSLKVLDQATVYLIFRDGSANLKLNIGMVLDHKEIVDTDSAELGEVSNSMERFPARTDSIAALQRSVAYARRYERVRTERERNLRRPEPCISADKLGIAASRPLRSPLRILPTFSTGIISPSKVSSEYGNRKPSSGLYYNTRLL